MATERVEAEQWWRVELNRAGTVTSCEAVERAERNSRSVVYIRAAVRQHAQAAAKRWAERRRQLARNYERRRRVNRKARGICETCDEPICADSKVYCKKHLEAHRGYHNARNAKIARGDHQAQPKPTPLEMHQRDLARHQRYRRMTVQLPVVLAVFDQLDGRLWSPFRQWLISEIADRGGRVAEAAE